MNTTKNVNGIIPYGNDPLYRALCEQQGKILDLAESLSGDASDALVSLAKVPRPMTVHEWNLVRHGGCNLDDDWKREYAARREELIAAGFVGETEPGSGQYQPTRIGFAAVALWLCDASSRLDLL